MKYDKLLTLTDGLEWFDLPLLVQLAGERRATLTNQLYRWVQSGRVVSLRRGIYTLSDSYRKVKMQPAALANALYRPSYLSGLWAMAYWGLIPESVSVYISVTSRKPSTFKNPFGEFAYHNIKQPLFGGYRPVRMLSFDVLIAEPEKALFDYWYLSTGKWSEARIAELRLSNSLIDRQKFRSWIDQSDKPRLRAAFEIWSNMTDGVQEEGVEL
jgi:hypothetical protein